MNTFLPYPDFKQSARVLDRQRLGKQRVEALQLLEAIRYGSQWRHHPACKMWLGYANALVLYGKTICDEWISRGYKDNSCWPKIEFIVLPWWLGNEKFHSAHRAALLAKDSFWYGSLGWKEKPGINYWWPEGIKNASNR